MGLTDFFYPKCSFSITGRDDVNIDIKGSVPVQGETSHEQIKDHSTETQIAPQWPILQNWLSVGND